MTPINQPTSEELLRLMGRMHEAASWVLQTHGIYYTQFTKESEKAESLQDLRGITDVFATYRQRS